MMIKIVSPFTSTFKSLKGQFIAKEKLIKSSFLLQKKSNDDKRKNEERERSINYENKLEKTLAFLGRPIKTVGKKLGFLDSLKQFITSVLLGFLAIRLLKYLPQLTKVFVTMLKVSDFILDMSGKLLNGLVTFVDKGYQAADHAKQMIRNIGGQKAIDAFENLNNQTNSLMNSVLIAGMLFTDFGGVGSGIPLANRKIEEGVNIIEERVKQEVAAKAVDQATKTATRAAIGPLGAAGIVLGSGLLFSALGEGIFQIKKYANGLEKFGKLSAMFKVPIAILGGVGTLFDIIGAPFRYGIELIRAAGMKLNDNRKGLEEQNKNLGKFDARVRENIREFSSVFAPLFTFFNKDDIAKKLQTPGSFGSLYGQKAVKDMGYYNGGMVIKKFAGGGYTRTVGDEDKKVKIPRTFEKEPTSLNPGSSVGGSQLLTKVFPYKPNEKDVMNQYDYMVSSYDTISGSGSLGSLMGLTIKSIMGDKVTDKDYTNVSDSLSSFLMRGIYEENSSAYNKIYSSLGTDKLKGIIKGEITDILDDKFSQIQNQLRIQLGLKELKSQEGYAPASEEDCPPCSTTDGQFVATGNQYERALLEAISLVEGTSGPDGYRTMYGGGKFQAPPWRHPNTVVTKGYSSAAAGKYQFMPGTWDEAANALGLSDFSPANQDKAALWKAKQRGVDPSKPISKEDVYKLGREWAALPGGGYGQDRYTADQFLKIYSDKLRAVGATPITAQIAPNSPAANVSDCVCDPEVPDGDPGTLPPQVQQPVGGHIVTSEMGMRNLALSPGMHMGVDISGTTGEHLKAFTSGAVEDVGEDPGGYGYYVNWIDSFGIAHFYGHMNKPAFVKRGQKVNAGTVLGVLGSTGRSSGPHLHWEAATNPSDTGRDKSAVLSRFNPLSRYSKESPFTGSRQSGGPTLSGGIRLLHKGEYGIDNNSVELFGGEDFFSMINNVENKNERAKVSSQLIQHLSKYTGRKIDQGPEVIVKKGENIVAVSPPTYVQLSSSGSYEESPNWQQDILERG